jgi:hypothetical protein
MLPADWEEYVAKAEREIALRPQESPKAARPIKKMTSSRQRRALSGTGNAVKAIYQPMNQWNVAITIDPSKTTFTTNLGGNCEPDRPHGKATQSRS